MPLTLDLLNPKSTGFDRRTVEDYYWAKFQVILIRGFLFYLPNIHTYTHTHIHLDKVIAIYAPPYYIDE